MNFTYPKKEKLCSHVIIDKLFVDSKPVYEFPLKFVFLLHPLPENVPVQSVMNVSKRRFKRAYKRNLLKRRMREAFRLNKNDLYQKVEQINQQLALMILYNHSEILPYIEIEKGMKKGFEKIISRLQKISMVNG